MHFCVFSEFSQATSFRGADSSATEGPGQSEDLMNLRICFPSRARPPRQRPAELWEKKKKEKREWVAGFFSSVGWVGSRTRN